jgi:hypothetical protein
MRWFVLLVVCVGLTGCYPPPHPPGPRYTVVCRTNPYGARVCVRTVSKY